MALPMYIDEVDFSGLSNKFKYTVTYEKYYGRNGGTMQSGLERSDLNGIRTIITWDLNAMTSAQARPLIQKATSTTCKVTYFDLWTNNNRTSYFEISIGALPVAFERHGLKYIRDGVVLRFRELYIRNPTN